MERENESAVIFNKTLGLIPRLNRKTYIRNIKMGWKEDINETKGVTSDKRGNQGKN